MRLLTIGSIEPIAGFEDRLKLEFDLLKEDGFEITYKKIAKDNISFYHCYVDDELLLMENNFINIKQRFINCIANALSDVIINYWEPELIRRIIRENYFYFNKTEQGMIFDFAYSILNYNEISGKRDISYQIKRKNYVLHKIQEFLSTSGLIILDGFVNFRLKEYMRQLEDSVDIAIDEYLMDKEYNEFIKLLRHFVDLQEPKRDLVNVVFSNHKIILMDENLNYIERDSSLDLIAKENPDVNMDDITVSTLINIAPRRITIHGFNGNEKREVAHALYSIFEGRVRFCNHCELCAKSKSLTKK
ncbi:MAG: putative sporulation protein YtxC [Tepidanaerobacteraceae bacterium]|nr:putative sporulation protein YtxC [Tepidanaerobacter sp.]HQA59757.1 putative sporulation protein YtxC [Tepidanaerobacteraceae bacterium]